MSALCLGEAVRILALRQGRHGEAAVPAQLYFSPQQIECLQEHQADKPGGTSKQQNSYPPKSLAWAAWLIVRMGGWDVYGVKKNPPGVISFFRGMERFHSLFEGWHLARKGKIPKNELSKFLE